MSAWSEKEVDVIVADYFAMLRSELLGTKYNKSEHRRNIMPSLDGRSHRSIDSKHMNISALMIELGLPYIPGYKPLKNYQRQVLPDAILDFLIANPEVQLLLEEDAKRVPELPSVESILDSLVKAPAPAVANEINETQRSYRPSKRNFLEIEAANKELGLLGEAFVLNFEKARLIRDGRENLAEKIEHTSQELGDGTGYDIRSYNTDGSDRFIEAKTTKNGIETPFFITKNEVNFSHANDENYFLYRVFNFRSKPRLYYRQGSVSDQFSLTPESFSARP